MNCVVSLPQINQSSTNALCHELDSILKVDYVVIPKHHTLLYSVSPYSLHGHPYIHSVADAVSTFWPPDISHIHSFHFIQHYWVISVCHFWPHPHIHNAPQKLPGPKFHSPHPFSHHMLPVLPNMLIADPGMIETDVYYLYSLPLRSCKSILSFEWCSD